MTDDPGLGRLHPPDRAPYVATLARLLLLVRSSTDPAEVEQAVTLEVGRLSPQELGNVFGVAMEYLIGFGDRLFGGPEGTQEWLEVMHMQALADISEYENEEGA